MKLTPEQKKANAVDAVQAKIELLDLWWGDAEAVPYSCRRDIKALRFAWSRLKGKL